MQYHYVDRIGSIYRNTYERNTLLEYFIRNFPKFQAAAFSSDSDDGILDSLKPSFLNCLFFVSIRGAIFFYQSLTLFFLSFFLFIFVCYPFCNFIRFNKTYFRYCGCDIILISFAFLSKTMRYSCMIFWTLFYVLRAKILVLQSLCGSIWTPCISNILNYLNCLPIRVMPCYKVTILC